MAILSSLIVNGSGRILNKLYVNGLDVAGDASFNSISATNVTATGALSSGGTLAVTGDSTLNGNVTVASGKTLHLLTNTDVANASQDNAAPLIIGSRSGTHLVFDNNEIMAKASGTTAGSLNLNYDGGNVFLSGGTTRVTANNGTLSAAIVTAPTMVATNLNVSNTLRATRFDLQTISQAGGSLYISPTVKYPNSNTTVTITKTGTDVLTLTISDPSITSANMSGAVWAANSKVKCSGTINGVATGTMDGTVVEINTSSHVLKITVSGENSAAVAAGTYTASQLSNLNVMMYQRRDTSSGNDYRVGLWLSCYDIVNNSAAIRIYGGTAAAPNAMLGNLSSANLPQVNGINPSGWGLYADNAFLSGVIVSQSGLIGGWTLGESSLSNGSYGADNSAFFSTANMASKAIGGRTGADWRVTVGSHLGITNTGALYCNSATITGAITANSGSIGGFIITSTANTAASGGHMYQSSLYTQQVDKNDSAKRYEIGISSTGDSEAIAFYVRQNTSSGTWTESAGQWNFFVRKDGYMYCREADVSGTITATSGVIGGCTIDNGVLKVGNANITSLDASKINAGTIGADRIGANSIHIGGTNLLKNSYVDKTSANYLFCSIYFSERGGYLSDGDTVTIQIKGELADTKTRWGIYNSGNNTANLVTYVEPADYDSQTGIYTKTFEWVNAGNTYINIYAATSSQSGTSYIQWVMLERGNQASDWGLSSDEIGGFTIDNTSIRSNTLTSGTSGSIGLSTANFTRTINGTSRNTLRFAIANNFGVANDGTLYCSNADVSGSITATSGKIGNFNISTTENTAATGGHYYTDSLYTQQVDVNNSAIRYEAGLNSTGGSQSMAFYVRQNTSAGTWVSTNGQWNFYVRKDGYMYCRSADISGTVTATAGTIGGCSITDGVLKVADANITNISGTKISANSINASKLVLNDRTNYITVNESNSASGISENHPFGDAGNSVVENGYFQKKTSTGHYITLAGYTPNCFTEGDELYFSISIKGAATGTCQIRIYFYGASGTTDSMTAVTNINSPTISFTTKDVVYTGTFTITATAQQAGYYAICLYDSSSGTVKQIYCKSAYMYKKTGTTLISDGAITTDKIAVEAITADKLAANSITVGGRNILRGTRVLKVGGTGGAWATGTFITNGAVAGTSATNVDITDSPVAGISKAVLLTAASGYLNPGFYQNAYKMTGHIGDRLTFSVWVKASKETAKVKLQAYNISASGESENSNKIITVGVANTWIKLSYRTPAIKYDHNSIAIGFVYLNSATAGDTLYVCAPMLEWGTIGSDWTPSPDEAAGFTIDDTAIHTANVAVTSNADNSIGLSSVDFTRTINGTSRAGLRFALGDKFGVTGDGILYCSSAKVSGEITATSGTIGGCSISNGVLQVSNANITDINASKINAGTISADRIAAGSITSGKLATAVTDLINAPNNWIRNNGSNMTDLLSMVKKWTNDAVSDTTLIQGGWIATNTITAQHLIVGDFENLCEVTESDSGSVNIVDGANANTYNLQIADGYLSMPQLYGNLSKKRINFLKKGDTLYYSFIAKRTRSSAQSLTIKFRFYNAAGTTLGTLTTSDITLTTSDATYTGTIALDQDYVTSAAKYAVFLQVNTTTANYPVQFQKINICRQTGQVMISDGAVTSDKIDTGAITADKINTGAVTADKIYTGAITADKINTGAVTADKIASNSITTRHLVVGDYANLCEVTELDPNSLNVNGYYDKTFTIVNGYLSTNAAGTYCLSGYKQNPLKKGDKVYWSFKGILPSSSSVKVAVRVYYFDSSKTLLGNDTTNQFTMTTTETLYSGVINIASNYADTATYIQVAYYASTSAVTRMKSMCIYRQDDGAVRIADGTVTAGKLEANCITSGQLAGSVTEMLTAGSSAKTIVDANKTSWDNASSWVSSNGTNMTGMLSMVKKWTNNAISDATLIQGGWIATNTITAQHLMIGDFANLCEVTECNPTSVNIKDGANATSNNLKELDSCLYMEQAYGNLSNKHTNFLKRGDKLYYSLVAKRTRSSAQTLTIKIRFYNAAGTALVTLTTSNMTLNTYDTTYSGTIDLDSDSVTSAAKYAIFLQVNSRTADYPVWVQKINIYKQASQVMISDGAITASKIYAGAVTADKIDTGAITADKIDTGAVTADKIYTGAVTADKIDTGAITADKIDVSNLSALSANIGSWIINDGYLYSESHKYEYNTTTQQYDDIYYRTYLLNSNTSYDYAIGIQKIVGFEAVDPNDNFICGMKNDGTIVCRSLMSGSISTGSITTGDIILDATCKIKQTVNNIARELIYYSYNSQNIYLGSDGVTTNIIAQIGVSGNGGCFRPHTNGQTDLGSSSYKWKALYASNGTIQTSDERKKDIISGLDSYKDLFMSLKPIAFHWKDNGADSQIHFGIGAQTVEKAMNKYGYHNLAMIQNDGESYSASYTELQMLTIPVVQEHEKTISSHEKEIESLKSEIKNLKEQIRLLSKK